MQVQVLSGESKVEGRNTHMIHYVTGGQSILNDPADALVNPVNCVGVMGKGLARQFRDAFPDMHEDYLFSHEHGNLQPGICIAHLVGGSSGPPYYIISFPTKNHWRNPSRLEWIVGGLQSLHETLIDHHLHSVAVPALGCGLGGLAWEDVRTAIEAEFSEQAQSSFAVDQQIEVWVYPPQEGA